MAHQFKAPDEPEVPSTSAAYFLREALRRIWISKRTSFVAISMIAVSLLILGMFLLVAENLERSVTSWQGRWRLNIYLDPAATDAQIRQIETHLKSRQELARHRFVTREEALQRFRTLFASVADLVEQVDDNPFPPSFEVEVAPAFIRSARFAPAVEELRRLPGVEQIQHDWEWLERLHGVARAINMVGLVAGGLLAIAAAFTIANVIRLTMMLYREEIGIMRLVGATERIIRGPFLVEGILQGVAGAILAVLLLYGMFVAAQRAIEPSSSLLMGFLVGTFLPWHKVTMLIAAGVFAGWFGSWLSVRERVGEE